MSTMDEAAPTPDGFGCLNPDGDPEAKPLVESSPTTAAAAVSAAGVEVVSAPNPEGSWDRLKQLQRDANHTRLKPSRTGIRAIILFGTLSMDMHVDISVSEAAISQTVAIRYYRTLQTCFGTVSHFF